MTAYWSDYKEYEETIYISVNGEKSKIGTFETSSKYESSLVTYNKNNQFAVVMNWYSDTLFVAPESGEPLKIKLDGELASMIVFTKTGPLSEDTSSAFPGIYVSVEGFNLYHIDANGEREKVLPEAYSYTIYDNFIYFTDEDNNLKIAKLAEATLSREEKITGDVEILGTESKNGYIYFIKDYNSTGQTGTLYMYKKGADPVKITSDVSCWKYGSIGYGIDASYSPDGKTIYFYKDSTNIKDTYQSFSALYKYSYGDTKATQIASDVVVGSINSGYASGSINNRSFVYLKYSYVKDEEVFADWYYFNGTDSSKMVTDVISY